MVHLSTLSCACGLVSAAWGFNVNQGYGNLNGYPNWAAGIWPPSNVGSLIVPQSPDQETISMMEDFNSALMKGYVQTLVNFGTRHTMSQTNSTTYGIGAARTWLFNEFTKLAGPSKGNMVVTMPCYMQGIAPGITMETQICNVQAEIKGSGDPNRVYVYTGHYDSRRLNIYNYTAEAPGADDNGSAVAIALEMVRILATKQPWATIIIAATAGEEQDLYGANFLAQTLKNASMNVEANFNDDIVGTGSNAPYDPMNEHTIRLFGAGTNYLPTWSAASVAELIYVGGENDTPARNLGRYVQEVNAGASDITNMQVALIYKDDRFFRGGDHEAFLGAGFPGVRFTEPNEDFFHQHQDPRVQDGFTYGDDIKYVDFKYNARVGTVNLVSLWSIANAPPMPTNVTFDTNIGFLADSLDENPAYVENVIQLYWNMQDSADLDSYEVVWRSPSFSQFTHALNVGLVDQVLLPISKDNAIFGLRAVGKNGKKSPAVFPLPVASQFF